jgi:serine/threonine protein kinase
MAPELSEGKECESFFYISLFFIFYFLFFFSFSVKSDIYAVGCTLYYIMSGINIYIYGCMLMLYHMMNGNH